MVKSSQFGQRAVFIIQTLQNHFKYFVTHKTVTHILASIQNLQLNKFLGLTTDLGLTHVVVWMEITSHGQIVQNVQDRIGE